MFSGETVSLDSSICFSSIVPLLLKAATGPGRRGARQERTGGPAVGGGPHPQDRNGREGPGPARVAARRGGTKGQRRPPRQPEAGQQRRRPPRRRPGRALRPAPRHAIVTALADETAHAGSVERSGIERGRAARARRLPSSNQSGRFAEATPEAGCARPRLVPDRRLSRKVLPSSREAIGDLFWKARRNLRCWQSQVNDRLNSVLDIGQTDIMYTGSEY